MAKIGVGDTVRLLKGTSHYELTKISGNVVELRAIKSRSFYRNTYDNLVLIRSNKKEVKFKAGDFVRYIVGH